jgi:alanine-synthesizing transaminase
MLYSNINYQLNSGVIPIVQDEIAVMLPIKKSNKLEHVCYDIRGPILNSVAALEEQGHRIIKLNIGNPAPFGFEPPDELIQDLMRNLPQASGYCDSKGLFAARKAIMQYTQTQHIQGVGIDDIYIGNGVSELIVMAMQGLLNAGDEVLIPAPDYPLWTAAVSLSGGKPRHYICDEQANWWPDLEDIRSKITDKTVGLVVINPNNPTGSVYPKEILEGLVNIAREFGLIIFADEIYEKILYDDAHHIAVASLTEDILCLSFNGLSKAYRAAGYRSGWMFITGPKQIAQDYIEGLNILASMRLCANVPSQYVIQTALGGYQSIYDLTAPTGRLYQQRELTYQRINSIPGLSCVKPAGALYLFPKFDRKYYPFENDQQLVKQLLIEEKVLIVQGTGFNWPDHDHFRLVFLPHIEDLNEALDRMTRFFDNIRTRSV